MAVKGHLLYKGTLRNFDLKKNKSQKIRKEKDVRITLGIFVVLQGRNVIFNKINEADP